jgi:hypothetical protein
MNTESIANRLVELCRAGKFEQAQKELYASDAVSIEPEGLPPCAVLMGMMGKKNLLDLANALQRYLERT